MKEAQTRNHVKIDADIRRMQVRAKEYQGLSGVSRNQEEARKGFSLVFRGSMVLLTP